MAKTSFVDHVARTGIPDAGPKLKGVTNSEEWGARVAVERGYGPGVRTFSPSSDRLQKPQDPVDKHSANYDNDASGWVRAQGETAERRPEGFTPGYRAPHGEPGTRDGPPLRSTDKFGPHK